MPARRQRLRTAQSIGLCITVVDEKLLHRTVCPPPPPPPNGGAPLQKGELPAPSHSCTLPWARASVQETVMSSPFPRGHAAPPGAPQGTSAWPRYDRCTGDPCRPSSVIRCCCPTLPPHTHKCKFEPGCQVHYPMRKKTQSVIGGTAVARTLQTFHKCRSLPLEAHGTIQVFPNFRQSRVTQKALRVFTSR